MTSSQTFPLSRRHPAWLAPILFPAIPFLAGLFADPGAPASLARQTGLFALLMLGVAAGTALPSLLDWLGWSVRKEAEQLRAAWIAGIFLTQSVSLAGEDSAGGGVIVFGLTSLLLASLTFGTEFQQRTMGLLLSQPIDRARLWSTKMGVLGLALLSHYLVFQLSRRACGFEADSSPDLGLALGGLLVGLVAWATTPTWTLLTRNLLAGMVFSAAGPLIAFAVLVAMTGEGTAFLVTLPAALGYAVAACGLGRRLWLRLESSPTEGSDGGLNIDAWGRGSRRNARASTGWRLGLLRKELRLQTVTFILASTLLLPLLLRAMAHGEASMLEGSGHLGVVLAVFTCLLAGAVAFAEERRLGTLESQVLQPVSRGGQWGLKACVAALPAALALIAAEFVRPQDLPEFLSPVVLGFAGFCFCLHASSGASHALRALLSGTLLGLVVWMISMLFCTSVVPYTHTLLSGLTYKDQLHNPGAWLAEVTRMSAAELDRARWLSSFVRPSSGYPDIRELSAQLQSVSALHLMPLVALLLCWRNFAQPAHAPGRILRQQCRILAVTVGTGLALVAGGILVARAVIRAELIVETRQHLDIEASLSPTQLKLRRHVVSALPGSPVISPSHSVVMHVLHPDSRGEGVKPDAVPAPWSDGEPGKRVRWMRRDFPLPLSPSDRQLLIDWGYLAPAWREGLIREAAGR